MSGNDGFSAGDRDERGHHADQRALARAVGPQEPKDFAFGDFEGDALDGFKVAITLDYVFDRDGRPCMARRWLVTVHQLALWDIDFGEHSGDIAHAGVVDQKLQADGLDIPLAAAYVALGGKVGFGRFGDDLALDGGSAGHDHSQAVAQLDCVCFGFGQGGVDPGLGKIGDGYDWRGGCDHFALPRRPHVDFAGDGGYDPGIVELDLRLIRQGLCVLHFAAGCGHSLGGGLGLNGIRHGDLEGRFRGGDICLGGIDRRLAAFRAVAASSRDW